MHFHVFSRHHILLLLYTTACLREYADKQMPLHRMAKNYSIVYFKLGLILAHVDCVSGECDGILCFDNFP